MSQKEDKDYAERWAMWKKRVTAGWGPVLAWIAKDIEPPPKPPEPQYPPDSQRFIRELKEKQKDEK
jgi:hypothetical protein